MCGRYAMDKGLDDVAKIFKAQGGDAAHFLNVWQPRFSIAPTDPHDGPPWPVPAAAP